MSAVLSARKIILMRRLGVGVGFGGDASLERAMRAHGNFAEYVTLCLVPMYLTEAHGEDLWPCMFLGFC